MPLYLYWEDSSFFDKKLLHSEHLGVACSLIDGTKGNRLVSIQVLTQLWSVSKRELSTFEHHPERSINQCCLTFPQLLVVSLVSLAL